MTALKFTTHNDSEIDTCGSSVRGNIIATRNQLVKTFGPPLEYKGDDGDGKVTTIWRIQFENGPAATIYDWKRFEAGRVSGDEVLDWHVGGRKSEVLHMVHEAFRLSHGLLVAPIRIGHRMVG